MPKYYVQSGSFRGVVARENALSAARWAVECVMKGEGGLFRLGNSIRVSERGFSGQGASRIETSEAVLQWMLVTHPADQS